MVVLALRQALDAVARADDAQLARELVVAVGGRAVGRRARVARLDEDLGGRAVDRRGVEVARPHREEVRDVVVREGDVELGARLERAPVVVLAREREDAVVRVELRDAVRAAPVRRRDDRAAQRLAAGAAGEVRPRVPLHLEVDDGVAAVEDRRADLHEDGRGRREVRVGRLDEAARRQRAGQARRLARHPDDRRPREAPLAVAEAVPRRDAHVVLDARQQRRVRAARRPADGVGEVHAVALADGHLDEAVVAVPGQVGGLRRVPVDGHVEVHEVRLALGAAAAELDDRVRIAAHVLVVREPLVEGLEHRHVPDHVHERDVVVDRRRVPDVGDADVDLAHVRHVLQDRLDVVGRRVAHEDAGRRREGLHDGALVVRRVEREADRAVEAARVLARLADAHALHHRVVGRPGDLGVLHEVGRDAVAAVAVEVDGVVPRRRPAHEELRAHVLHRVVVAVQRLQGRRDRRVGRRHGRRLERLRHVRVAERVVRREAHVDALAAAVRPVGAGQVPPLLQVRRVRVGRALDRLLRPVDRVDRRAVVGHDDRLVVLGEAVVHGPLDAVLVHRRAAAPAVLPRDHERRGRERLGALEPVRHRERPAEADAAEPRRRRPARVLRQRHQRRLRHRARADDVAVRRRAAVVRVDLPQRVGQEEHLCIVRDYSGGRAVGTTLYSQIGTRDAGHFQNLAADQDVRGVSNTSSSSYRNSCDRSSIRVASRGVINRRLDPGLDVLERRRVVAGVFALGALDDALVGARRHGAAAPLVGVLDVVLHVPGRDALGAAGALVRVPRGRRRALAVDRAHADGVVVARRQVRDAELARVGPDEPRPRAAVREVVVGAVAERRRAALELGVRLVPLDGPARERRAVRVLHVAPGHAQRRGRVALREDARPLREAGRRRGRDGAPLVLVVLGALDRRRGADAHVVHRAQAQEVGRARRQGLGRVVARHRVEDVRRAHVLQEAQGLGLGEVRADPRQAVVRRRQARHDLQLGDGPAREGAARERDAVAVAAADRRVRVAGHLDRLLEGQVVHLLADVVPDVGRRRVLPQARRRRRHDVGVDDHLARVRVDVRALVQREGRVQRHVAAAVRERVLLEARRLVDAVELAVDAADAHEGALRQDVAAVGVVVAQVRDVDELGARRPGVHDEPRPRRRGPGVEQLVGAPRERLRALGVDAHGLHLGAELEGARDAGADVARDAVGAVALALEVDVVALERAPVVRVRRVVGEARRLGPLDAVVARLGGLVAAVRRLREAVQVDARLVEDDAQAVGVLAGRDGRRGVHRRAQELVRRLRARGRRDPGVAVALGVPGRHAHPVAPARREAPDLELVVREDRQAPRRAGVHGDLAGRRRRHAREARAEVADRAELGVRVPLDEVLLDLVAARQHRRRPGHAEVRPRHREQLDARRRRGLPVRGLDGVAVGGRRRGQRHVDPVELGVRLLAVAGLVVRDLERRVAVAAELDLVAELRVDGVVDVAHVRRRRVVRRVPAPHEDGAALELREVHDRGRDVRRRGAGRDGRRRLGVAARGHVQHEVRGALADVDAVDGRVGARRRHARLRVARRVVREHAHVVGRARRQGLEHVGVAALVVLEVLDRHAREAGRVVEALVEVVLHEVVRHRGAAVVVGGGPGHGQGRGPGDAHLGRDGRRRRDVGGRRRQRRDGRLRPRVGGVRVRRHARVVGPPRGEPPVAHRHPAREPALLGLGDVRERRRALEVAVRADGLVELRAAAARVHEERRHVAQRRVERHAPDARRVLHRLRRAVLDVPHRDHDGAQRLQVVEGRRHLLRRGVGVDLVRRLAAVRQPEVAVDVGGLGADRDLLHLGPHRHVHGPERPAVDAQRALVEGRRQAPRHLLDLGGDGRAAGVPQRVDGDREGGHVADVRPEDDVVGRGALGHVDLADRRQRLERRLQPLAGRARRDRRRRGALEGEREGADDVRRLELDALDLVHGLARVPLDAVRRDARAAVVDGRRPRDVQRPLAERLDGDRARRRRRRRRRQRRGRRVRREAVDAAHAVVHGHGHGVGLAGLQVVQHEDVLAVGVPLEVAQPHLGLALERRVHGRHAARHGDAHGHARRGLLVRRGVEARRVRLQRRHRAQPLEEHDRVLLAVGRLRRADEQLARADGLERGLDLGRGRAGLEVGRRHEAVGRVVLERERAAERRVLRVREDGLHAEAVVAVHERVRREGRVRARHRRRRGRPVERRRGELLDELVVRGQRPVHGAHAERGQVAEPVVRARRRLEGHVPRVAVAHLLARHRDVAHGRQRLEGLLDDVGRRVVGQRPRRVVLEGELEAALQVAVPRVRRDALHLDARVERARAAADLRARPDAVPGELRVRDLRAALVPGRPEGHLEGRAARREEVERARRVGRPRRRLEARLRRRRRRRVAVGVRGEDARGVVLARRERADRVAAVRHGAVVVRARRRVDEDRVRAQGPAVERVEVGRRVPLDAVARDLGAAVRGRRVEEHAQRAAAVDEEVRVRRRVRLLARRRQRRRLRRPRLRGAERVHGGDAHRVRLARVEAVDDVRHLAGLALEGRVHGRPGVARRRRAGHRRAAQHVRVGHGVARRVGRGDVGHDLRQRQLEAVHRRHLVGPLLARGAQQDPLARVARALDVADRAGVGPLAVRAVRVARRRADDRAAARHVDLGDRGRVARQVRGEAVAHERADRRVDRREARRVDRQPLVRRGGPLREEGDGPRVVGAPVVAGVADLAARGVVAVLVRELDVHVPERRERLEGPLHVQGGGLEVDLDRRRAVVRQLERARHVVRHGVDLDDLDLVDALAAPPLDLVARHLVAVVVEGRRPRHGERRGRVRDADAGAARERLQLHRAAREAVRHGRRRRRDGGEGARAGGVHAGDAHVVLGAALEARQRVAHPDARPRLVRVGHLPVELVVAQDLVVGRRGVVEDLVAARHVAVPAGARQARRRAARARERRGGRRVRGEVRRRRVLDDEGRHLGLAVGGPERQPPLHAQLVRGARHALDRRALGRVGRRVGLEVDRGRRVAVARRVAGGDADAEAVRDARVLEEVLDRVAVRRARLDVQGHGRRVVGREVAVLEEVRAAARRGRRAVADDGLQRGAPAEARADDGDGPDLAHEGVAGRARVRGEGDAVVHVVVLREGLLDGHVAHVVEELERPLDLERRRAHLAEVVVVEARVHGERPGVLVAAARVEVERRRRRRVARDAERLHLERADVARHVRPPLHLITRDRLAAVVLGRVPLDDELVPVAAREPHVRRRRRLDGHGGVGEGRVDHRRVGVVEEPRRRHEAVGLRRRRPQEPRDGAARRLAPLHRYVDERAGLEGLGGGAAELRVGNTAALVDLVLEGVEEQLAVDEEPRAVVHLRVEREDLVEGRAHEARPPHRDVVPARVRDRVLDLELEVDAVVDARRRGVAVEPAVVEVLAHEPALLRGRDVHEVRAHARRRVARVVEALAGVRHVRADGLGAAQPRHELRAEAPRHARDLLAGLVVRRLGARVVVRDDGRVRAR